VGTQDQNSTYQGDFEEKKDTIFGEMTFSKTGVKIGGEFRCRVKTDENFIVKNNKVEQISFVHPEFVEHKCHLLPGAKLPAREVDNFEIININRKFFQGEQAIQTVERILNIDCGVNVQYKYGYKNCHATHDGDRSSQMIG